MDRGLVVGGALICASFLIAVALNQSDSEAPDSVPNKAVELPTPDSSVAPNLKCLEPDDEALTQHPDQAVPICE